MDSICITRNEKSENNKKKKKKVLLLPWLAHGHITPFFELAKRLASQTNALVHLCSTPATLASIKNKAEQHHDTNNTTINLVELNLDSPPLLPPHLHTTNGLPLHLNPLLKKTLESSGPSAFSSILDSLKPDLLLYDFLLPWAPPLAAAAGVSSALFLPCSAAAICYYLHLIKDDISSFPFSSSVYLRECELRLVQTMSFDKRGDGDKMSSSVEHSDGVVFIRSFYGMEEKYLRYLETLVGKKVIPVGALSSPPLPCSPSFSQKVIGSPSPPPSTLFSQKWKMEEIRRWLEGKGEGEVVYVSLGTEYYASREEKEEVGWGLERSGVSFIWVVRFAEGEERVLPQGLMEKVEGRGVVVDWADQREILQHRSVGGMVTHCGWGSLMEAVGSGVPVVAMPMHLDQFFNCRLVVESGFGIEVERDHNGCLDRVNIGDVVKQLVHGQQGEAVRSKVRFFMDVVRSDDSLDLALRSISQILTTPPSLPTTLLPHSSVSPASS